MSNVVDTTNRQQAKRFSEALTIQGGAVNPTAIANTIVHACKEIMAEPGSGTETIYNDPAVRLMVHQLAFLCKVMTGAEDFAFPPNYSECTRLCEAEGQGNMT